MSKTQPARGMRDFLPSDVRKRNYVISIIKEVYESYGFEPLETPAVENLETLTGKYGEEGNQLIFKILKRGEKLDVNDKELADLALRYDLTVPLARVVANYKNELPKFFKRYQIQPVWRADRPARGRFREFYQCDVDAIGSSSMIVEAELISAVSEILERLGFVYFGIRLNNRKLLKAILDASSIPESLHIEALTALDKLDKIGIEGVGDEFAKRGIAERCFFNLLKLLVEVQSKSAELNEALVSQWKSDSKLTETKIFEDNFEMNENILELVRSFISQKSEETKAIEEIKKILELTENSPALGRIHFDPNLARGLSYYTGTIFEIFVPDLAGSLGGGGRYDGLIGMFGKEQIPACGFSLGLERILVVMNERGMFPPELETNSADVLVTVWNEETAGESLKLASELRGQGLRVLVYPEADKLGKQFKYADSLGIKKAVILRDEEIKENKAAVKNLQTGEQETVDRDKVYALITKN